MFVSVADGEKDTNSAIDASNIGWVQRIPCMWIINGFNIGNRGPFGGSALMANKVEFSKMFKQQLDLLGLGGGFLF